MTLKSHLTALAACALAASACASVNETNIGDTDISEPGHMHWTDEQQAAYDQCGR